MALTWREIAAPDLSASLRGYEQFNNTLQSALGGLRETAGNIDRGITDRNSSALMLQALQANDPNAVRAITAAADPRRVNAAAIAMLGQRPGQILNEQNAALALAENQYGFDQTRATDARAPLLAQARALAQADDAAGLQAFTAANPGLLEGLGYKTVSDFQTALQNDVRGAVGIAGNRQDQVLAANRDRRDDVRLGYEGREQNRADVRLGFEQGRYNWESEDRATGQQADAYMARVLESSDPNNIETVRNSVFNGDLSRASPRVRAAVYGRLQSQFPGLFRPDEVGLAGGAGGSPLVPGGGQMSPFQAILSNEGGVDANDNFLRSPKGAWGPSQLMPGTAPDAMAAAGFDRNDQRWKTDPNINRQAGQAYYNQLLRKYGDPVQAAAAYNAGPGNFDKALAAARARGNPDNWYTELGRMNLTETQKYVRDFQAKTGTGSGGGSTPSVMMGAALAQGQNRTGRTTANDLVALAGDNSNPREVVSNLRAKGSPFEGANTAFVQSQINDIVERSRVNGVPTLNYAQAGKILSDGLRVNNNSWRITNFLEGNSVRVNSRGDRIDNTYVNQEIQRARSGGIGQDAVRDVDVATSMQGLQAAQVAYDRANAALVSAQQRAVTQPGLGMQIPLLRARVEAARQALTNVRSAAEGANRPAQEPIATGVGAPSSGGFFSSLVTIRRRRPGE